MRTLIQGAHGELLREIGKILQDEPATRGLGARGLPGLTVTVAETQELVWLLWDAERHRLDITLRGSAPAVAAARAAIERRLPGMEFDLPGHLVADINLIACATSGDAQLTVCELCLEALTIAD